MQHVSKLRTPLLVGPRPNAVLCALFTRSRRSVALCSVRTLRGSHAVGRHPSLARRYYATPHTVVPTAFSRVGGASASARRRPRMREARTPCLLFSATTLFAPGENFTTRIALYGSAEKLRSAQHVLVRPPKRTLDVHKWTYVSKKCRSAQHVRLIVVGNVRGSLPRSAGLHGGCRSGPGADRGRVPFKEMFSSEKCKSGREVG